MTGLIHRVAAISVLAMLLTGPLRAAPDSGAGKPADPLVRMLIPQDGDAAFSETMVFARIIMGHSGIPFQVEHMPWDRTLRIASTQRNVVVAMMSRTPEREAHFLWVGQLHRIEFHLYRDRERGDIVINKLADVGRYRLGVVGLHDVITQYFLTRKVMAKAQLEVAGNDMINMRKLLSGHIDLMATSDEVVTRQCRSAGVDCKRMLAVMALPEIASDAYMAYSSGTAPSLVQRTRQAYVNAILDPTLSQIGQASLGVRLYREKRKALGAGR